MAKRVDDGDYGARLIQGNGVALTWAPDGPGWTVGVSWNQISLYGVPTMTLEGKQFGRDGQCERDAGPGCASARDMQNHNVCLYLSQDGSRLETTRQGYWRMPTTDEVVRSLVQHGENAGCTWNGQAGKQPCAVTPDKETPLWNPQSPIIYLWTADQASPWEAHYVTDNGSVYTDSKYAGLGSRGYRCMRIIREEMARDKGRAPFLAPGPFPSQLVFLCWLLG